MKTRMYRTSNPWFILAISLVGCGPALTAADKLEARLRNERQNLARFGGGMDHATYFAAFNKAFTLFSGDPTIQQMASKPIPPLDPGNFRPRQGSPDGVQGLAFQGGTLGSLACFMIENKLALRRGSEAQARLAPLISQLSTLLAGEHAERMRMAEDERQTRIAVHKYREDRKERRAALAAEQRYLAQQTYLMRRANQWQSFYLLTHPRATQRSYQWSTPVYRYRTYYYTTTR